MKKKLDVIDVAMHIVAHEAVLAWFSERDADADGIITWWVNRFRVAEVAWGDSKLYNAMGHDFDQLTEDMVKMLENAGY